MGDNVTFQTTDIATPPDGTKVSADESATSGKMQRVKLAYSADGVDTHVPADADGLLVNLGANNDVAVASVPAPLSTTGGGTEATALRVTVATDSTGVLSVDDNGASLTVDGTVAITAAALPLPSGAATSALQGAGLPATLAAGGGLKVEGVAGGVAQPVSGSVTANAGTNLNTSLLATESGGNLAAAAASLAVIDDWDESDRAKTNPIVGQAGVAAGAGAVAANVPRVTLASDDPAVASLSVLDDWDESDRAKVNPIAGQVGVQGASGAVTNLTQRVVLATDVGLPAGTAALGAVTSRLGQVTISVTPTVTAAGIYASGDAVGGLMTFANAARVSGGTIIITKVLVVDNDQELAPMDLVLFDRTIGGTADNSPFDPTDAEMLTCIGVIKVSDYSSFNDNSIATRQCSLTATLNGTSLFGQLVVRSAPTYTAVTDITVIVQVVQD